MIQACGELDLAKETVGSERCGEIRMQHLERDNTIVFYILRKIDSRHPAASKLSVDRIRLRKRITEPLERQGGGLHQIASTMD